MVDAATEDIEESGLDGLDEGPANDIFCISLKMDIGEAEIGKLYLTDALKERHTEGEADTVGHVFDSNDTGGLSVERSVGSDADGHIRRGGCDRKTDGIFQFSLAEDPQEGVHLSIADDYSMAMEITEMTQTVAETSIPRSVEELSDTPFGSMEESEVVEVLTKLISERGSLDNGSVAGLMDTGEEAEWNEIFYLPHIARGRAVGGILTLQHEIQFLGILMNHDIPACGGIVEMAVVFRHDVFSLRFTVYSLPFMLR